MMIGVTLRYLQEIMATAAAMGANTIRSTTLGVSVGHPLTISPSLGVFDEEALKRVDYAVYAAGTYGLRLIIPLTDQWDYYHGGKSKRDDQNIRRGS